MTERHALDLGSRRRGHALAPRGLAAETLGFGFVTWTVSGRLQRFCWGITPDVALAAVEAVGALVRA